MRWIDVETAAVGAVDVETGAVGGTVIEGEAGTVAWAGTEDEIGAVGRNDVKGATYSAGSSGG